MIRFEFKSVSLRGGTFQFHAASFTLFADVQAALLTLAALLRVLP